VPISTKSALRYIPPHCGLSIADRLQVPRKFVPEVNKLLRMAAHLDLEKAGHEKRAAELTAANRRYVRRVEAYIRKRAKFGLKHKPTTAVEVSSLPLRYRSD
jgi:hypothetical protein